MADDDTAETACTLAAPLPPVVPPPAPPTTALGMPAYGPPLPPLPPYLPRRRVGMHIALMLLTLGAWVPVWVLWWWTQDARTYNDRQRYRQEWAAYEQAWREWQAGTTPPPR